MLSIVLSRRDFREHDQIISLYTKEKGKVEVLARGIKKITSKNAAYLIPLSLLEAEIISGKEVYHLGSVQPVNIFKNIRADLSKSLMAGYAAGLLDKLIHPLSPERRIFKLFASWLEFVEQVKEVGTVSLDVFVLKLFYFLGFDLTKVKNLPSSAKQELLTLLKDQWVAVGKISKPLHRLIYRFAVYHSEKKLADWEKILKLV